jgi:UDP-glucose 4-epimerase
VSGAGGFVGRRLIPLLAERHHVIALARRPLEGVETVVGDLAARDVRLPERLDAVVHLAQSRRHREWPGGAADMFAVNVDATFRLLAHAAGSGASHFVLASTGAVYAPAAGPLRENAALGPKGFYPRSKLAAEILAEAYATDLAVAILRPFAIYGAGQESMLVANLAHRVRDGEEIVVEGDPGLRINPIHVDDAARAFAAALTLEGSLVVNVAGGEVVSVAQLAGLLAEVAGTPARIRHTDGASPSVVGDTTRMRARLGVTPRVALRDGLAGVISRPAGPAR